MGAHHTARPRIRLMRVVYFPIAWVLVSPDEIPGEQCVTTRSDRARHLVDRHLDEDSTPDDLTTMLQLNSFVYFVVGVVLTLVFALVRALVFSILGTPDWAPLAHTISAIVTSLPIALGGVIGVRWAFSVVDRKSWITARFARPWKTWFWARPSDWDLLLLPPLWAFVAALFH